MSIELRVFATNATEIENFVRLVGRGRHADIPYYESVDEVDPENGWVMFSRLDCAPAPRFKVAVAGNLVIISAKSEAEVRSWFKEWRVQFRIVEKITVDSKNKALRKLKDMRSKHVPKGGRTRQMRELRKLLTAQAEAADNELLARI